MTSKNAAGNFVLAPALLPKGGKPTAAAPGAIAGVLSGKQLPEFLASVKKVPGVVLLTSPRVTTRSGQRAVIEIIRELKYPTEWKEDDAKKGLWLPTAFEVRNVGVTLEVEPVTSDTGTVDLTLTPQLVEHLGWVDVETGKAVKSVPADENLQAAKPRPRAGGFGKGLEAEVEAKFQAATTWLSTLRPVLNDRRLRPVFSGRKANASVSILSGDSVVFDSLAETEKTAPFKPKTPGRRLVVVITAREMGKGGALPAR